MKPVERKYKVTKIYVSLRKSQLNKKMDTPKVIGVYSGVGALHAIREASRDSGVYMDCMTAELVKESK